MASLVKPPCRHIPLRSPEGAPEPLAPPCIRHRALPFIAGQRHGFPARFRAWQSGALVNSLGWRFMGLSVIFTFPPVIMYMLVQFFADLDHLAAGAALPAQ